MYAKAYISSGGVKILCRFNHFRSRQQFLFFCSHSLHSVWEEWNKDGSLSDYHKYISFKLQEAGRLFIFEGGEVVSHRNLLVYQNEIPVSPDILNGSSRHMLGSFLQIQYSSWLELCRLCESFFSVYPGYYIWTGKEIELLELGDALWTTGYIRPLAKEKTKRLYFRRLFGFFNLPVPDDPCHRLGELGLRGRPDIFLAWLRDRYLSYWEDRED